MKWKESKQDRVCIYAVEADLGRFRSLLLDLPEHEVQNLPKLRGRSLKETWRPLPVSINDAALPSPDVWQLLTLGEVLAMTTDAAAALEPCLSMAGELLPLSNHTSEPFSFSLLNLLNVLRVDDCIDTTFKKEERRHLLLRSLESADAEEREQVLSAFDAGSIYRSLRPHSSPKRLSICLPRSLQLIGWGQAYSCWNDSVMV